MSDDPKKFDFTQSVNELEKINTWFQNEDIDLDEGLHKLKVGKDLIKKCRNRLHEVENEFIKIKGEFAEDYSAVGVERDTELPEQQPIGNGKAKGDIEPDNIPF